jgi:hypothetical protein
LDLLLCENYVAFFIVFQRSLIILTAAFFDQLTAILLTDFFQRWMLMFHKLSNKIFRMDKLLAIFSCFSNDLLILFNFIEEGIFFIFFSLFYLLYILLFHLVKGFFKFLEILRIFHLWAVVVNILPRFLVFRKSSDK